MDLVTVSQPQLGGEEACMAPMQMRRVLRAVYLAAFNPALLVVAGAAVFIAPLLGAWWPLISGALMYLLLIVCCVASPAWRRRALALDDAVRSRLPDEKRLSTPSLRTVVAQIGHGRATVARVLAGALPEDWARVRRDVKRLNRLERYAAQLALRADALAQFLGDTRREYLQAEMIRLTVELERVVDPEAKHEFQEALADRQTQVAFLEKAQQRHDRIMALLERIVATVDKISCRLVYWQFSRRWSGASSS